MADAADATAGAAMLTANAPAFVEHMNAPVAFTPFDVKCVTAAAGAGRGDGACALTVAFYIPPPRIVALARTRAGGCPSLRGLW